MKKILYLIDSLGEGAGRVVYDLAKELKDQHKIYIATLHNKGNLINQFQKLNLPIININKKPGISLNTITKVKNILKKYNIDILHTHNVDAYEYGIIAGKLAGCKTIHTAHGKSVKTSKLKKLRENIYHKSISLFCDHYIAVSKDLAKYASKNWSLKKPKIIPNGIDTTKYSPKKIKSSLKKELNIKDKDRFIGIVAGLRPVKNHQNLINSMPYINKEIPNTKLLIIGEGPLKQKLKDQVKRLKLKNVKFLGNRTDVVDLFNLMEVNILSSHSECTSMTLLESLACKTPCVATNVGGNKEIIDKNVGVIVPPDNPRVLAKTITKLLNNKKLRESMGEEGRKKVIEKYSIERMVKDYNKLL